MISSSPRALSRASTLNWVFRRRISLHRLALPAILAIALSARATPAEQGQLDASQTLFTVMAAINAAGYDAGLASPNNNPLRAAIRASLAKRNIPSVAALKVFFEQHHRTNDTAELSQYISFALTAGGPPDFAVKTREVDIPPDVTPRSEGHTSELQPPCNLVCRLP